MLLNALRGIRPALPPAITLAVAIVGLLLVSRFLARREEALSGQRFRNQLLMVGLTFLAVLLVIIAVPDASLRGQLLSLVGILLSAAIALSSTTLVGNAMAGLMLRAVRNFRIGDFIRCGDHFGRVSERGLVHTEIQTEDRDLTTLPNLYLVAHPVTVIRSSGTIISATVSLGYDVPREKVEPLLVRAGAEAGLSDPFVQVLHLGDFSVTYRIAGLLGEVKTVLSARARLRAQVMDQLHRGGVEIVSPTFMNTRAFPTDREFIPEAGVITPVPSPPTEGQAPESIAFDKAEEAESLEKLRLNQQTLGAEIEAAQKELAALDETAACSRRGGLESRIQRLERQRAILRATLERREKESGTEDPN